jgi:adenylate kinase family enzyme
MSSHEVLLLGGAPGSGKSSIAKRVVESGSPEGARHLSIGDLRRSILAGETPSVYAEVLRQYDYSGRKAGSLPSSVMTGIIREFILVRNGGLTIIDGFPRYPDRVGPFNDLMQGIGAKVLALCVVEVRDETVVLKRLEQRSGREGQLTTDPADRLANHMDNTVPTLKLLAADYPCYRLDGTYPLDVNAKELQEIYNRHTASHVSPVLPTV